MIKIPSTSKQYITVPVTGTLTGTEPVHIAVIAATAEEPASGDWKTAVWDNNTDAKILIGPGTSLALANGLYRVWVKVTASQEIPVIRSGLLRIT